MARLMIALALISTLASAANYQYVYQYVYEEAPMESFESYQNLVKMPSAKQAGESSGCEFEVTLTYSAETEVTYDAASSTVTSALALAGLNIAVLTQDAATGHSHHHTHHASHHSHHTGHTNHTVHSVHTVAPTVHTNHTAHISHHASVHTVHVPAGGATVHSHHSHHASHASHASPHSHEATMGMAMGMAMGMGKANKAIYKVTLLLSQETYFEMINDPLPSDEGFLSELSSALGVVVTHIAYSKKRCDLCSTKLEELASKCPNNNPTPKECQLVNTGILCTESDTDTDPTEVLDPKHACPYDMSTNAGLMEYFISNC